MRSTRSYAPNSKTAPPTAEHASKSPKTTSSTSSASSKPDSKSHGPSPASTQPHTPTSLSSFRLAMGDNRWHVTPGMKISPQFHMPSLFVDAHNPPPSLPSDIHCTYAWFRGPRMETVQQGLVAHARPENKDPSAWTKVSAKRTYTPTQADAMHVLKFEIYGDYKPGKVVSSDNANPAPIASPLTGSPVRAGRSIYFVVPQTKDAPLRSMSKRRADFETDLLPESYSFSAMSWNTLARRYTDRQRLSNCPDYALSWNYRKESILEDNLKSYSADLISLQECEDDAFEEYFQPQMRAEGYGSIFEKRGSVLHDGCAVFYKKSKFRLVHSIRIDFDDLDAEKDLKSLPYPSAHLLTHNVATAALFEIKASEQRLENVYGKRFVYVVNTHHYWDPLSPDIKLLQVQYLMEKLERFKAKMLASKAIPIESPILLAGDFNSTHDSAVYDYITSGSLENKKSSEERLISQVLRAKPLKHSNNFDNALVAHGDAPTNVTINFSGCLDYVFHSPSLVPIAVLENPITSDSAELKDSILTDDYMGCIPNPAYPSDHLPLMVQFGVTLSPGPQL